MDVEAFALAAGKDRDDRLDIRQMFPGFAGGTCLDDRVGGVEPTSYLNMGKAVLSEFSDLPHIIGG